MMNYIYHDEVCTFLLATLLFIKASYDLVIIMIKYLQYHQIVMAPRDLREALKIRLSFDFAAIFKLLDFVTC